MRKDRISTTIDLILLIIFTVSAIFISTQLYLGNIVSFFWLILLIFLFIAFLVGMFIWLLLTKKLAWLRRSVLFIFSISLVAGGFYLGNLRSVSQQETDGIVMYYQMNLLSNDENVKEAEELDGKKIGFVMNDRNHIQAFDDINASFQTKNCQLIEYYSMEYLIHALEEDEIQGMILSDHNLAVLKAAYPQISHKLVLLNQNVHEVLISHTAKPLEEGQPISILLTLGEDDLPADYVSYSLKCLLLFIDPIDHEVTLIEIPNNLYIPNVAYDSYPDALYNVSYNGIDNLLYSIESIFGVEFDYFIKTSFQSILNCVDIMQGINIPQEVCVEDVCVMEDVTMNAGQVADYYRSSDDLNTIIEGIFEKRDELKTTKLMNFLNNYKRSSFTNLTSIELRRLVSMLDSDEGWSFVSQSFLDLTTSYEPCVSFGANDTYEVSIIDADFLDRIYSCFLKNSHMEIMSNFAFDLDRMRNNRILPYSNEKLITTSNMDWKISEYFALLPESIVSPIEIEKWNGTIRFEQPNYDPDAPIQEIE